MPFFIYRTHMFLLRKIKHHFSLAYVNSFGVNLKLTKTNTMYFFRFTHEIKGTGEEQRAKKAK